MKMADHMDAAYVLPIHWHTFLQSEEPTLEPIQRLKEVAAGHPERIAIDNIGQTWSLAAALAQRTAPPPEAIPSSTTNDQ